MTDKRVFIFGDYQQAETRVVAWRGPVPQFKEAFKKGLDIHLEIAKQIGKVIQENKIKLPNNLFNKTPWQELTKKDEAERQAGKTGGHAGNYGIQEKTYSIQLGIVPVYAKIILAAYHTQFMGVKRGYQAWIENQLKTNNRTITTALGRPKTFFDMNPYSFDDVLRAAYAYYPQSTIGDLITDTIVTLGEHFEEITFKEAKLWTPTAIRQAGFDVRLNIHDAVGLSVPDDPELIKYAINACKKAAEVPFNIDGDELIIPMDFKIGPSWGELREYHE